MSTTRSVTYRLIGSTSATSDNYCTISDASNMYDTVDSTTRATITTTKKGITQYYAYLRGFNFSTVPNNATVTSITARIKGYYKTLATPYISTCNNTTVISTVGSFTTSNSTKTLTITSSKWSTYKGYGSNFGFRIPIRRSRINQEGYCYVYGAELTVVCTIPVYEFKATLNLVNCSRGGVSISGTSWTSDSGSSSTITVYAPNENDYSIDVSDPSGSPNITPIYDEGNFIGWNLTWNNASSDHNNIVIEVTGPDALYTKKNGAYKKIIEAYEKVNGSWVKRENITEIFDPNKKYVCGD